MKIAFVINSLEGGGAERVVSQLACYWAVNGHDVVIVTLSGDGGSDYPIHDSVLRINLASERPVKSGSEGPIRANLALVVALRKTLIEEQPNVAIAMMTTANCLLSMASLNLGITTLGSERNFPPDNPLGLCWNVIRKIAYANLSTMIAQTPEARSWLERNTRATNVVVIPNPISLPLENSQPSIPPHHHIRAKQKLIVTVGRLVKIKRQDRLIRAFAMIATEYPDWVVAIIGSGPEKNALTRLADDLGVAAQVKFVSRVGNPADWYCRSDIFVMTSESEGFPNVLLEALAHEIPVVSMDSGPGPRNIVTPLSNGLLVPNGNEHAFANALKRLMSDEGLRREMSVKAKKSASAYSIEGIASKWEQLFGTLSPKT